jgi:diadenosine tetraphosphate (Ap4A) HIT family hydrolase
MENSFYLDPRLAEGSIGVASLELCEVLLFNNALFPWVILVPQRAEIKEIIDLNAQDRITLIQEISMISEIMQEVFSPDKLNVAALGNIVPQLHVHIIARYQSDSAWPQPVFGNGKKPYDPEYSGKIINRLKEKIILRLLKI